MTFEQYTRTTNENQKFVETTDGKVAVNVVTASAPKNTLYENATLTVGETGSTPYNVKLVGSMFATVTNAAYVLVQNNDGSHAISVKLNALTNNAISIPASSTLTLPNLINVTNIFISTLTGHSGTVAVTLFGQ
jgi:hypothetical protein